MKTIPFFFACSFFDLNDDELLQIIGKYKVN